MHAPEVAPARSWARFSSPGVMAYLAILYAVLGHIDLFEGSYLSAVDSDRSIPRRKPKLPLPLMVPVRPRNEPGPAWPGLEHCPAHFPGISPDGWRSEGR